MNTFRRLVAVAALIGALATVVAGMPGPDRADNVAGFGWDDTPPPPGPTTPPPPPGPSAPGANHR